MTEGYLVLIGQLKLNTAALIGSGQAEETDMDVLVDREGKPFIPATSFCGILRYAIQLSNSLTDDFWGDKSMNGKGSWLRCSVSLVNESRIAIRDGIQIDSISGVVAADGGKYDYQVVEPGAEFQLNMQIRFPHEHQPFAEQMMATIIFLLENEKIQVGAKTNNGLGRIKLLNKKNCLFNFQSPQDTLRWLKQDFSQSVELAHAPFDLQENIFEIEMLMKLRGPLIIRSSPYQIETDTPPDSIHLSSGGQAVLSGSSLKGALRKRAERILHTLNISSNLLNELFGTVNKKTKTCTKGKLSVEETALKATKPLQQTRIKIDRFTGGTIDTALLQTMPVFSVANGEQNQILTLRIRDFKKKEAGLLLLLLKDLWTGDLAVGGEKSIGRGRFQGVCAQIQWRLISDGASVKKEIRIENPKNLQESDKNNLEDFVNALVKEQVA